MPLEEIVKSLMEGFKTAADIKTVYGEPMTFFGKTLIPIAKVGYGLGAGEGNDPRGGSGGGAGGGGGAQPVGFLLVSEEEVRFIPLTAERARPEPHAMAFLPMIVGGIAAALVIVRRLRRPKEAPAT
ncbi:MAG: GerW family sporulation protein [Dehalococcoidia bacterium]